jgi:hypothetical protein
MNIRKLTTLQQFVEKIPLRAGTMEGWDMAGFLNQYSLYPEPIFYSLILEIYEEDHFGTLSLIRYYIDVCFGPRNG